MEGEVLGMRCRTPGLKDAVRQSPSNTILIGPSLGKGTKSHLISCKKQQNTLCGARALCSSLASGCPTTLPLAFHPIPQWDSDTSIPWLPLSSWKRKRGTFSNTTIQLLWATRQHQILEQGQPCSGIHFSITTADADFKPNPAVSTCCLPSLVILPWCQEGQRLLLLEEMQCIFYYHNASGNSDWALTVNMGTKGQWFLNAVYHLTTVFILIWQYKLNLWSLSNRKSVLFQDNHFSKCKEKKIITPCKDTQ